MFAIDAAPGAGDGRWRYSTANLGDNDIAERCRVPVKLVRVLRAIYSDVFGLIRSE